MTLASVPQTYVWDPFVRVFHWVLVGGFAVAYLTEDDFLDVHVWAGYIVGGLILARLVWGFTGPRYARFSDFVRRPRTAISYIKDMLLFRSERHLGHSPGGGAMVVLLLILVSATVVTGLIFYGGEEQAGPLAGIVSRDIAKDLDDVHKLLANITLGFVVVHVAAVIYASVVYRENLVRAMITGYKRS